MIETTYQGIPDTLTFLPLSPPPPTTLHFAPSKFMTLNDAGGGGYRGKLSPSFNFIARYFLQSGNVNVRRPLYLSLI